METAYLTADTRREYHLKNWLRGLYALLGLACLCGAGFMATHLTRQQDSGAWIGACFILLFGLLFLFLAQRYRLTIDGDTITYRGFFREKCVRRDEISGIRRYSDRNSKYLQLILKEGRGTISILDYFDTDDDFRAWMQPVPDLDQIDRQAVLDAIEQQTELGATPEERLAKLTTAKRINIALCVLSGLLAVGSFLAPIPMRASCLWLLMLVPLACAYFVLRSPLLYALMKSKADPRAELVIALFIAAFGLNMHSGGYSFVEQSRLWSYVVWAMILFFTAFFRAITGANRPRKYFALVFVAFLYCHAAIILANGLNDASRPAIYTTTVVNKFETHGKNASNNLVLAEWGPVSTQNQISVSRHFYDNTEIGDTVCLSLREGRLRMAWYRAVNCPQLNPIPEPKQ